MADFGKKYGSPSNLTVANLASLADTDMWQSGKLDAPEAATGIQVLGVEIWYEIELADTPNDGDQLIFRIAEGSEGTPEIWPGGIAEAEVQITTAADKQKVKAALDVLHAHSWQTNMPTTDPQLQGMFEVELRSPDWQLLIEADGQALDSTGHTITVRYFHVAG